MGAVSGDHEGGRGHYCRVTANKCHEEYVGTRTGNLSTSRCVHTRIYVSVCVYRSESTPWTVERVGVSIWGAIMGESAVV